MRRPARIGVSVVLGQLACGLGLLTAQGIAAEPLYLEGFCDPLSVQADEEVGFHVSTNAPEFAIEVARVGAEEEVVWTKTGLPGQEYPPDDGSGRTVRSAMYGVSWPAAAKLTVPREWKSGFYRVVLRNGKERRGEIPQGPFHRVLMTNQPARFVMFFAVRAADPGQ